MTCHRGTFMLTINTGISSSGVEASVDVLSMSDSGPVLSRSSNTWSNSCINLSTRITSTTDLKVWVWYSRGRSEVWDTGLCTTFCGTPPMQVIVLDPPFPSICHGWSEWPLQPSAVKDICYLWGLPSQGGLLVMEGSRSLIRLVFIHTAGLTPALECPGLCPGYLLITDSREFP